MEKVMEITLYAHNDNRDDWEEFALEDCKERNVTPDSEYGLKILGLYDYNPVDEVGVTFNLDTGFPVKVIIGGTRYRIGG